MAQPQLERNQDSLSRRAFVKTVGAGALTASVSPVAHGDAPARIGERLGPRPSLVSETPVARLHQSLSAEQRRTICFPFEHPLRARVGVNWKIVESRIADMTGEQRALCREIFQNLCSEDGFERLSRAMKEDYGGFENYHVALFGEPGGDRPCEWVLTGRHVTLRSNGHHAPGGLIGGPIFLGHASGSFHEDSRHAGNVWRFQGERANAVFQALDPQQQAQARIDAAEPDEARYITLPRPSAGERGLAVAELDESRKALVGDLVRCLLQPFRTGDGGEEPSRLREAGDVDRLRLTCHTDRDIGDDGEWDIWKVEGPAFSWYFHGHPHVHSYIYFKNSFHSRI
jgi:class 3 adenylate cyclase